MDYYTGRDALKRVPIYDIAYPLERGIVTDWSLYEKVLFDCFFKCALPPPNTRPCVERETERFSHTRNKRETSAHH